MWTKRVGNNPDLKLLLLHGGPGATSEYFEAFDSYLPAFESLIPRLIKDYVSAPATDPLKAKLAESRCRESKTADISGLPRPSVSNG